MRGVHVSKSASALVGTTTATDEEAIYIDDLVRGTTTRSSIRWKGHTTGTPTNSHGFFQETAHAVGTNRYSINVLNAAVIGNPSGISQDVLTLNQLNTGAVAGAHILLNDKAGDPTGLTAGQLWRNATKVKFYDGTLTHDLNPLTTKGDLIVHNGTIEVRRAVGTNGQVLTADSAEATGVKWATPSSGGANVGTAVVDFGAFPGQSDASVAVTGQAGILSGSVVNAWLRLVDSADHTADEHLVESLEVYAGNIVAGDGFTVYVRNDGAINEPVGTRAETNYNHPSLSAGSIRAQMKDSTGGAGTRIYGQWNVQWQWA